MNALRSVTRVGSRIFSTAGAALLFLFGCLGGSRALGIGGVVQAEYPSVDASFLSALEWRFVGPFRGGRVPAVAGDADNPLVFYFGAAHGGVWKTTDGGETWTNVGLRETRHISRLRIHPTDPDTVYVAAMGDMFGPNPDRGIYRTTDGGETWEHILYRGETTGAVDLAIDPTNPSVIIASLNHHVTYPWDEESGGPTTGLFKTTDGGDTWQLTHQDPGKMEIPNSYNHITADTQDPDVVYIQPITGLLKSTDAGRTFERVRMENWDPHTLWIDPNDSRRMIEGGDGGPR